MANVATSILDQPSIIPSPPPFLPPSSDKRKEKEKERVDKKANVVMFVNERKDNRRGIVVVVVAVRVGKVTRATFRFLLLSRKKHDITI